MSVSLYDSKYSTLCYRMSVHGEGQTLSSQRNDDRFRNISLYESPLRTLTTSRSKLIQYRLIKRLGDTPPIC